MILQQVCFLTLIVVCIRVAKKTCCFSKKYGLVLSLKKKQKCVVPSFLKTDAVRIHNEDEFSCGIIFVNNAPCAKIDTGKKK